MTDNGALKLRVCTHSFIRQNLMDNTIKYETVANKEKVQQLPLRNSASAMYFFVAKFLSIAVMTYRATSITSEVYVR